MISFLSVNIDCESRDSLTVFNDDRSFCSFSSDSSAHLVSPSTAWNTKKETVSTDQVAEMRTCSGSRNYAASR